MGTYPREAWDRLGGLLVSRRVELDVRFRNRRTFAETVDLDYRVLYDIESARRVNFTKSTLRAVEQAYRLKSGSLDRTLGGGPLEPLEVASAGMETPAAAEPTPAQRVVVEIPKGATPAEVAGLQAIQAILDAQQREIDQLAARQERYEQEVAELRKRIVHPNSGHANDRRNSA